MYNVMEIFKRYISLISDIMTELKCKMELVSQRDFAFVGMQNSTDRSITDESDNDVECR